MIIFSSERFTHHLTPPGHPERPERAEVLLRVAERWGRRGATVREPAPADVAALTRVHAPAYVAAIAATAGSRTEAPRWPQRSATRKSTSARSGRSGWPGGVT